jgi:DNA-directed RNA polymerase subunit K/omega
LRLATLGVIIRYTIVTASIERAAQKQAEATQMPVVVLKIELRQDSMDEAMERIGQGHIVQGAQLAVTANGHFLVRNIGTGPALNLTFDFLPVGFKG